MVKLYLNNTFSIPLDGFNRGTHLVDNTLSSNGYCSFKETSSELYNFLNTTITSFLIKKDDTILYDAGNINAHITSIDENLLGENVGAGINIQFDIY